MSALAVFAWILGTIAIGGGLLAAGAPAVVRRGMAAYPRSVWPGRILLAIDMIWAAYEVSQMHLGNFDSLKIHLYWLAPVCIIVGAVYLDELLSVRALGGLLLLVAGPILDAARWHESDWRLVMTLFAYLWIVAGLTFLLTPWWFRRIAMRFDSDAALRIGGIAKAVIGVGMLLLAVLVY